MVVHCPKCYSQFATNRDLERHLERKVPCDAGAFKCSGCAQSFTTQKGLNAHIDNKRCKGKSPALIAHEATQEVERLQNRMQQQEQMMQMTNAATAAAAVSPINITQNITINIHNHPVSSLGAERVAHFSQTTDEEMLRKLNLTRGPSALAAWCKMLRADEDHPENHNALLLTPESKEMACCRDGTWTWGDTHKTLLEISRADINRLYTHLGRYDQNASVQAFRHEYLVHDLMTRASSEVIDRSIQSVMDAVAGPIIALTQKFYAVPEEQDLNPQQLALQAMITRMKEHYATLAAQEATCKQLQADTMAHMLELQRQLVEATTKAGD